jgi:type II secretory pathway component PulF
LNVRNKVLPILAFGVFFSVVIVLEHYTTIISSVMQFFSLLQVHIALFILILIGVCIVKIREKKRETAHPSRDGQ